MEKFELESCRDWIEKNRFTLVALQLPDEDLDKAQDLIDNLTSIVSIDDIEFVLVGDGCSPCCNDLINTQYCQAQGLIHFGHSCLTTILDENSPRVSIFYVFYQRDLPDEALLELTRTRKENEKEHRLVFYDPCFSKAIEKYSNSPSCPIDLVFTKIDTQGNIDSSFFSIYGRFVKLPIRLVPSNYAIIFISNSKASRNNLALYFYAYEFCSFPKTQITTQRLLSKRMFAIEAARNASSFGLLLSSNSLLNLPTTIYRLIDSTKKLLEKNQRSFYTFLMNTISLTKLNNFERNIEIYVLCTSCPETFWLSPEHKQFNIPLISIVDVLHAFQADDDDQHTTKTYSFDLREILRQFQEMRDDECETNPTGNSLVLKDPNALVLQDRSGLNSNRPWWGLQINKDDDCLDDDHKESQSFAELKEGKFGIASAYRHEPKP